MSRVVALTLKPKARLGDDIRPLTKVDLPAPDGAEKMMALPSPWGNLPAGILWIKVRSGSALLSFQARLSF